MEKYHIGQEILKEVKAKFPSVAAFARELCKSNSATYEIFGKTSLDTDLLLKVSKLLDRDFFREFSEKCLNGEVAVVDKQTAENSISLLSPEDKLHTVSPSQTMDVVEEYLLMPRKKPLVVFYSGVRSRNLPRFVCKKGEEIYGEGMVRNIRLEPAELMHFEFGVMSLAKMPQKVVVIKCTMARDYNSHVLIAERLAAESGKHVVLLCFDPIHIPTLPNRRVVLKSLAVSTFNSWNQRAHIFIADDKEKRFAYLIELFQAIKGKGYMDRIYDSIEGNENWADTLKNLLEEAKQNLTTFEDIVLEESCDKDNRQVEYHQVSTIQPTVNDLNRPEGISHICTHLRYRMVKGTGEIFEYETMSFEKVKKMLSSMNIISNMTTILTKEDQAMIKEAKGNKTSGTIYSEDGLRLLKVLGNSETVEVKDGVKVICNEAFMGLDSLHEVVLPTTVTDLGTRAFASCHKLFKVTMPGVEFIGQECFALCESLKEIALPETLGKIGKGAFASCKALEQINIPSHVKVIDKSAFRNSGLKSLNIVISEDCKCWIYDRVFANCKHLESVYLNKNVKIQECMAFAGCTSLKTIEFENPSLTGSIGEINATMLIGCTSLEKIIVPKSKYNHYPDFNIQGYESAQFETRDFNSLVTPKE